MAELAAQAGLVERRSPRTRAGVRSWLGFLADEQRVAYRGPAALHHVAALLDRPAGTVEDTFVAANLLALSVFRAGEVEQARHLCRAEIAYALRRRHRADWPLYAMYALQPQVNLFRLQGYGAQADEALAGLAGLAPLTEGHGAELPDLSLDTGTVGAMDAAGLPVRALARNVHISDTCKILYRHGLAERLCQEAAELCARYPRAGTEGPHHAAEAPWLVAALDQAPVPPDAVGRGRVRVRWLAYIRLVHVAAHRAAQGDHHDAVRLASWLVGRWDALTGRFTSAVTPLRWLATLGDTLQRCGRDDLAEPVLRRVLVNAAAAGDPALTAGLRARLGLPPAPPAGPAPPELPELVSRMLDRLSA
ncbi:MAG TPA: hypothetical protein VFM55_12275 [Micromonosporaceae bacterium]|nr:hypothetical protein [Micromonosporaceae bacterium]